MLFLVPLTALAVLAFVVVSFVGAQLEDVPEPPKVALLRGVGPTVGPEAGDAGTQARWDSTCGCSRGAGDARGD